jgi:hypothetical protein
MAKQLTDLNDHLFTQLERLGKKDISQDDLGKEIERSKAMASVAQTIINSANLALNAQVAMRELGIKKSVPMIGVDNGV